LLLLCNRLPLQDASGMSHKVFAHLPSDVGAYEAEEIGVEHLLRDVKDATVSTLATRISAKLDALRSLEERLREIRCYLDHVLAGRLPLNHDIMAHLQDVVNLLPNLNVAELVRAFAVKTNDMMLVIYLSSIIRSVTAVHNLINNKVLNMEREALQDAAETAPVPPPPLVAAS
jgi:26S proteasome regulatory subunit N8